jgi:hypothetical protein
VARSDRAAIWIMEANGALLALNGDSVSQRRLDAGVLAINADNENIAKTSKYLFESQNTIEIEENQRDFSVIFDDFKDTEILDSIPRTPFRVDRGEYNPITWLASMDPDANLHWVIVISVPETDVFDELESSRRASLILRCGLVFLAVWLMHIIVGMPDPTDYQLREEKILTRRANNITPEILQQISRNKIERTVVESYNAMARDHPPEWRFERAKQHYLEPDNILTTCSLEAKEAWKVRFVCSINVFLFMFRRCVGTDSNDEQFGVGL